MPAVIAAKPGLAARLPRGWPDFVRQLAIWLGFGLAYQVARGLADRGVEEPLGNARAVMRLERRAGLTFEHDAQRIVLDAGAGLVHAVDWTYWLSQFAVVGLVLLWIYLYRYPAFLFTRDTLIVTNVIGLVGYVLAPTAPPRLVPGGGFVDTLASSETLNHGTGLVELAANPYAAMPSLHAADALVVGVALALLARRPWLKALFALWPVWVGFALVASANHFWLDVAAGFVLAAAGALAVSRYRSFATT